MSAMTDLIAGGLAEGFALMSDTLTRKPLSGSLAAQPRVYGTAVSISGRIHNIAQRHRQDEFGNWRHVDTCEVRVLPAVTLNEGDLITFAGITWRISGRAANAGHSVRVYLAERESTAIAEPRSGGTP